MSAARRRPFGLFAGAIVAPLVKPLVASAAPAADPFAYFVTPEMFGELRVPFDDGATFARLLPHSDAQ